MVLPTAVAVTIRRHVHLSFKLLTSPLIQLNRRGSIWTRSAMLLVAYPGYLLAISL